MDDAAQPVATRISSLLERLVELGERLADGDPPEQIAAQLEELLSSAMGSPEKPRQGPSVAEVQAARKNLNIRAFPATLDMSAALARKKRGEPVVPLGDTVPRKSSGYVFPPDMSAALAQKKAGKGK